ncbi:CBS domain-containing protein [Candidatus Desantisbacteria bacterium]|nr:CBS domain-containing protein [Candidatus Desantisbacteria bacterium]
MIPKKSIGEMLTQDVVFVTPTTPARDVISIMRKKKISCVLIMDDKTPVGIFTERNLVYLLHQGDGTIEDRNIEELMSTPVLTIESNANIYQAHDFLEKHGMRHLVVVEPDGRVAGVVTQTDIINNLEVEYFLKCKDLSKVMTRNVAILKKGQSVQEAIDIMAKTLISCVLIVDNNVPVGILTERDITGLFHKNKDMKTLKIEEAMSRPVQTIPQNTSLYETTLLMTQKKIRRLVVVNNDGCIIGIVTQYDILKELGWEYMQSLHEIIQEKEKKLIEAEKLAVVVQIAKEVAHEIRNPLQVLTIGLYYLQEIAQKDDVKTHMTIERMNSAVSRIIGFVDDFVHSANKG